LKQAKDVRIDFHLTKQQTPQGAEQPLIREAICFLWVRACGACVRVVRVVRAAQVRR
jgi:hypothetical protein